MSSRGRDKFKKFKSILSLLSAFYSVFPLNSRKKIFEHYRNTKGLKGIAIRYALIKTIAKGCGDNVSIHPGCYILSAENLMLGNNVSIHPMCYIDATGEIEIGNDVSIAHATTIMSTSHSFSDVNIPIKDQEVIREKVVIEDNVWLGSKATILCGNTVKTGSVVGASAVVTKDVESYTVVAGVPAKVIKEIK